MSPSKPFFQSILALSLVVLASACTTAPPVPVALDTGFPAVAQVSAARFSVNGLP